MITQAIIDFFRDVVANWITGAASLLGGLNLGAAGAGLGSVSSSVSRFLALFLNPGLWGAVLATFGVYLSVFLGTALISIIGRRFRG